MRVEELYDEQLYPLGAASLQRRKDGSRGITYIGTDNLVLGALLL